MTRATDRIPPIDALLCESCGYPLDALPPTGDCPECGTPIGDSFPERRSGSPWQVSTGLRSWIATIFRTLFHPWKSWDTVTADAASSIGLAIANCFIAALIATLPTSVFIWRSGRTVDALVALAAATAIGGVVLLLLTTVERLGIGFFGRRRGWRISPAIAWAVCGHASAGWIVCALLLAGAMVFAAFSGFSWVTSVSFNAIVLPAPRPPAIVAVAAFLLGMLIFETLVYIGFRAMRFANHPRHGANESRAASELPSDQ